MTSDTTTITLPLPPDALIVIALAFAILFGSYIIFSILPRDPERHFKSPLRRVAEGLGFRVDTADQAAVLFTAILSYLLLFAFAMVIAVRMLGGMAIGPLTGGEASPDQGTSLGFGALLAAILGAPFIIWRSWIAAKQAAIAEEALFNDKINAAATDLAARRQVTRVVKDKDGKETVLTEYQDDLVTRAAAIDRLEGLALEAMDRGDFAPAQRIARMLSIYVQELSREHPPEPAPEFHSRERTQDWAKTLRPVSRPDMERATQSLGRIIPNDRAKRATFDPRNIDLRRCNLQGFDLKGLIYQGAQLGEAQMQGTDLFKAQMQGADLTGAQMQGANLFTAQMQGATLDGSQLQGATLRAAQLQGAELSYVKMRPSPPAGLGQLDLALLQKDWIDEMWDDGSLMETALDGAAVMFTDDTTLRYLRPHWPSVIGFLEDLPQAAPDHWKKASRNRMVIALEPNLKIHSPTDVLYSQWRVWAAKHHPDVTIAPDYSRD
ncbi:pentapeptide repeat-containing protein [Roseicyclus sp.]